MSGPKIQMALDIHKMLKRPLRELQGFAHPDGRPMTPREVQAALLTEIAHGRELLPIGKAHVFAVVAKT